MEALDVEDEQVQEKQGADLEDDVEADVYEESDDEQDAKEAWKDE